MLFYISLAVTIALVITLLYLIGSKPVEAFMGSSQYDQREEWETNKLHKLIFGEPKRK